MAFRVFWKTNHVAPLVWEEDLKISATWITYLHNPVLNLREFAGIFGLTVVLR